MAIEIYLTEGPNIKGLLDDRRPLYVGYNDSGNYLAWCVIEGRTIGTPKSYKLHVGNHGFPLEETDITRVEYTKKEIVVNFIFRDKDGKLTVSNTSNIGRYVHNGFDEAVKTIYNFFGDGKTDMRPNGCDEYYKD